MDGENSSGQFNSKIKYKNDIVATNIKVSLKSFSMK